MTLPIIDVRAAEELGVREVARGRQEHEHDARHDALEGGRERDMPERLPGRAVEILARLDERGVHALEGGVDRQHHQREVAIEEPADDGPPRAEELHGRIALHAEVAEPAVDDAVVTEQDDPREHADQVVHEPRQDQHHHEQVPHATAIARDHVRRRIADDHADQRGDGRERQRAEERRQVGRRDDRVVVAEIPARGTATRR